MASRRRRTAEQDSGLKPGWFLCLASVVIVFALLLGVPVKRTGSSVLPSWTILDKRCNVKISEHFLAEAEIRHLLGLINGTGGWEDSPTGGPTYQVPRGMRTGGFGAAVAIDPVVRQIEERIAAATGIPIHPDEDMISFAKILPRGNQLRNGHYVPFGLHHDTDTKPNRAKTVLVYLTDTGSGGRTIFPLCGDRWPVVTTVSKTDFADALGNVWTGKEAGYTRQASFDVNLQHPFNDVLASACKGEIGLSVTPKAATAIMFDSVDGAGQPERATWHAGCNVQHGTKLILQKFKETPLAKRELEQAYFSMAQTTPYRPMS